jgi:ribosomal protein S1
MTVKMSLGIKQLSQDPWTDITSKYPVGSKHSVSLETLQTLVFS